MSVEIKLESLNKTELGNMIRERRGVVIKRSVDTPRLIEILRNKEMPKPEEISPTTESRKRLQMFLEQNWATLNSQLPCKGENRGKCTIYPCPEGRHLDCYLSAEPHMKVHAII